MIYDFPIVDILQVCSSLSSDKRLKIINILREEDQTAVELYKKFTAKYDPKAHRETIYRDLELLHGSGLVTKEYDDTKKRIYYHLLTQEININLVTRKVTAGR